MRWEGERQSDNVEDRRRITPGKAALGGGGLIVVLLLGYLFGIDPAQLQRLFNQVNPPQQQQQADTRPLTPQEKKQKEFAATILAFTEDVWTEQFRANRKEYQPPKLVLFTGVVDTACGRAPAGAGPFYCPADKTVYLDPTFFDDLEKKLGGSKAEFSQAYVIAHEVGHHVQNLLGYNQIVEEKRRTLSKEEYNKWSVRLELQADYLAGVWAHYGQKKFRFIEPGDIESAITTANAIGDDRLQKRATGFVSPERFTHGTSQQRMRWFKLGLQTGDLSKLSEIFKMDYRDL